MAFRRCPGAGTQPDRVANPEDWGDPCVAPAVKPLFRGDMTEQRRKLIDSLAVVVRGLSDLPSILPAASALAKRHVEYGAKPEHYPVVGQALLWTLARALGPAWRPQIAAG